MNRMLMAAVLALPLAACGGGDDLHLLARFSPRPGQAFVVVVPLHTGSKICTGESPEHRILLMGPVITLQRLERPAMYPGVEKYVPEEWVRVSANTFTEVNVGHPERISVIIAEKYVVEGELQRQGGTILVCQEYVQ